MNFLRRLRQRLWLGARTEIGQFFFVEPGELADGSSSFRVDNPRSISVVTGRVATAVPVAATIHLGKDRF